MNWIILFWITLGIILLCGIIYLIVLFAQVRKIFKNFSFSADDIYECTIIRSIEYNSEYEMMIWDFSLYEKSKIIGLTIYVLESVDEILKESINRCELKENFSADDYDEMKQTYTNPMVFPHQSVFHTEEETLWLDML